MVWEVPRRLGLEVFGQESPDQQLYERPENEFDDPHRMAGVEPEISQGDGAEDAEVHAVVSALLGSYSELLSSELSEFLLPRAALYGLCDL